MRAKLIRLVLLALNAADGMPMPESSLIAAVQIAGRIEEPTDGDVREALKDAEARSYVIGVSDDLAGRTWTLTDTGKHKVRQLR